MRYLNKPALLGATVAFATTASTTPIASSMYTSSTPSSTTIPTLLATAISLPAGLFGSAIEAASVDIHGNIFAADFRGTNAQFNASEAFARVFPHSNSSAETTPLFVAPSNTTLLAGSRFLSDGRVLFADAVNHQVLVVDRSTDEVSTYCSDPRMLQPNDIALSSKVGGLIYLSGQNFTANTTAGVSGDLWTCTPNGAAIQFPPSILAAAGIHRTNGIETSPCGSYLYLSSATNFNSTVTANKIFRFALDAKTGAVTLATPTLFHDFAQDGTPEVDVDGMRTDIDGTLYVTRNGIGKVAVLNTAGNVTQEISFPTLAGPANLEFGGPAGKSLVAVGRCAADNTVGCAAVYEGDVVGKAFQAIRFGFFGGYVWQAGAKKL